MLELKIIVPSKGAFAVCLNGDGSETTLLRQRRLKQNEFCFNGAGPFVTFDSKGDARAIIEKLRNELSADQIRRLKIIETPPTLPKEECVLAQFQ